MECEEVQRLPFVAFVPLPIPHAFHGNNFADKLVAIQNARTILTRSILDHAMVTNNPRYTVVKGGLTNPRELIDNRVAVSSTSLDQMQSTQWLKQASTHLCFKRYKCSTVKRILPAFLDCPKA